jgi:septal ring-binding cell division protein DamX
MGVLIGGFRERAEAVAALDALPGSLRQFRPYVRTLEAVREESRRADPR